MIKIAIDVRRAVELVITIPMLGFYNDIVEVIIAHPDLFKNSMKFNNTFLLFKFYISSYYVHYLF